MIIIFILYNDIYYLYILYEGDGKCGITATDVHSQLRKSAGMVTRKVTAAVTSRVLALSTFLVNTLFTTRVIALFTHQVNALFTQRHIAALTSRVT